MPKLLPLGLWIATALGTVAIALTVAYTLQNTSGHTSFEPRILLLLFVPLMALGSLCFAKRHLLPNISRASLCALAVGFAGTTLIVTLIVTLDRTNTLVQYERWIQRGMP